MKAVRLHVLEGPDELVYEEVPEPEPGSGETIVRLRAAALNRRDLFATQGMYLALRLTPCPGFRAPMVPVRSSPEGTVPRDRTRGPR